MTDPAATPSVAAPPAGRGDVLQSSGAAGLDDVLGGGFVADRLYLLEGQPGAGKTTLALQFLLEGAARGETVLYVTLSETAEELNGVARSHGWSLDRVHIHEMQPADYPVAPDEQYTMFHPSELELGETTMKILAEVERLLPSRVVFDSLSELRLLAGTSLRYRRQVLALKQFFAGRRCTLLLLDDMTAAEHDLQVHSIAHGVVRLEQFNGDYGATRRRLVVSKYRGRAYRDGYHDYRIVTGGLSVFPRLVAAEHGAAPVAQRLSSGLEPLDRLLGGGVERGTSTLLVGAPGTGKSSFALQFAITAAERGERASLFVFDESLATLAARAAGMGMDLATHVAAGRVALRQIDPAEMSPGEFVHHVRDSVSHGASVVVIDSLNGYLNAMPDERFLIVQLHELLTFLGQSGVATVLVGAQHGLIGTQMRMPVDASYLADAVLMLRYYEHAGEVCQAISVVKKRGSAHERTIRAFALTGHGIRIGEPLRHFRGILSGIPTPAGSKEERRADGGGGR